MIDFHSHLLPALDDGSSSVSESLAMLAMEKEQGVDFVFCTPHFHANAGSVSEFLEKREASFESLSEKLPDRSPRLLMGAEVRYYNGISRMEDLEKLKIEGTDLLLLEMPSTRWTDYTVKELLSLASARNLTLVLAHVERYEPFQSKDSFDRLRREGILMQVNASYFTEIFTSRRAIRQLAQGAVQLIGSDCHDLRHRPPRIGAAYARIEKKLGPDFVRQIHRFGESLLVNI